MKLLQLPIIIVALHVDMATGSVVQSCFPAVLLVILLLLASSTHVAGTAVDQPDLWKNHSLIVKAKWLVYRGVLIPSHLLLCHVVSRLSGIVLVSYGIQE